MRRSHMANTFHYVRYMTGAAYREAWLRDAGVFVQLCPRAHGSGMCPGYDEHAHTLPPQFDTTPPPFYGGAKEPSAPSGAAASAPVPASRRGTAAALAEVARATAAQEGAAGHTNQRVSIDDPNDEIWPRERLEDELDEGEAEAELYDASGEDEDEAEEGTARCRGRAARIKKDAWGYEVLVIVHEVDIHQIGVAFCRCTAGKDLARDVQLLQLGGLFPATQKKAKTCFTLRGLAYHQVDRLECKVAPQAISRKLRRHTSPLHPSTVPVWLHCFMVKYLCSPCVGSVPGESPRVQRVYCLQQSHRPWICAPGHHTMGPSSTGRTHAQLYRVS